MKFYVYELVVVPDGNVCYVGKGSGKRMWKHKSYARLSQTYGQHGLYRRLRELLDSGKDFAPRKVFETDSEEEALVEEKKRIDLYGFNHLFNSSTYGCRTVADINEGMRQAMSKGQRDKASRNREIYGKGLSPEHCAAIGMSHLGTKRSKEACDNISASKRGKALTQAHRKSLRIRHKINPETEAKRAEIVRQKMKQLWASGKMKGNTGRKNPHLKHARKAFLSLLQNRVG